jgi:hypothetical protein
MSLTGLPNATLRKLKIAAYVDRVLSAAEARLTDQSWWNEDVENLIAAIRRAPIDRVASVFGTWAGLKWLDAGDNLVAADWLMAYPSHAPAWLFDASALFLNYCPHGTDGRVALPVPRTACVLTAGNTRVAQLPIECAGARVYWATEPDTADVRWWEASGREIAVHVHDAPCFMANSTSSVPLFDYTSGAARVVGAELLDPFVGYLSKLPGAVCQLLHEGRALVEFSDAELGDGDTRPRFAIHPRDVAAGNYTHVARQLATWLGAEYVRVDRPNDVPRDLARMAVQHASVMLEDGLDGSLWLQRADARDAYDTDGADALRNTVHRAIESTLGRLADVVRPLELSERALQALAPVDPRPVVKTRDNDVMPANWGLVDHISALGPSRREHVVGLLSGGSATEDELFVMAAARYADGQFSDALALAERCAALDNACMEYKHLVAFCRRHLGRSASFDADAFGGRNDRHG